VHHVLIVQKLQGQGHQGQIGPKHIITDNFLLARRIATKKTRHILLSKSDIFASVMSYLKPIFLGKKVSQSLQI
jgi:hypothetical protein